MALPVRQIFLPSQIQDCSFFLSFFKIGRAREGLIVWGECRLWGIRRVNNPKVCQHVRNCSIPPITVDPTNYPSSGQVPLQNLI